MSATPPTPPLPAPPPPSPPSSSPAPTPAPSPSDLRRDERRVSDRFRAVRARARSTKAGRIAWRIGITVVGVAVVLIGIVLLPLPGPGWLIIFAGLGLLATEYAWAARLLRWARRQVGRSVAWSASQGKATRVLIGLAVLVLVAGLITLAWFAYVVA
jgi:uncharacterized protein (TIGR02611 family)